MRVLMVNDLAPGPTGGVEMYISRLADGLRTAGDDVEVFAGEIAHHGVGKLLDFWDPRARRLLQARVDTFRPDLLHFHNVTVELSVSVLGVAPGVPRVMSVHDPNLVKRIARPGKPLRTLVDDLVKKPLDRAVVRRRVDRLLPVSPSMADLLRDAGFTRVETLSPIVGEPIAVPRPVSECTDVVFASRLAADKGAVELVQAFLPLLDVHPAARLLIAGDGAERERVAAAAAPAGDRVRLLGQVDQAAVSALYAGARVVVLPYRPRIRLQGSSLALVEAAMHGRPVVSTDDPAIVDLAGQVRGVDVVPAESPAALTAAMDRMLGDSAEATRRGAEAAEDARTRFSVEAVVARVQGIYADVVASAPVTHD